MGLFTFCVVAIAFTGLVSGGGVLPDSVEAAVGGTVMFTTSIPPTQTPFFRMEWDFEYIDIVDTKRDGIYPKYKDRVTLFNSTGSLELRNVTFDDAGLYQVAIELTQLSKRKGKTKLKVYERVSDARVTVSSSDSVEFISSVTLSCSASGLSLSFLWLNGSDEVTASDRVNLTDGGATLTIATVRRSDQGPFRCKVSNPVSSSTSDPAELSISYGPDDVILKTSPQIDDFEEGSDVLMSCSADSRPAAQFQWLFNGELLSFTGAQLELMKIQMNQSGDYSCQAFNSKTHRYTTSEPGLISVLKRIMNISVESSSNQPMEGSSVNIICDASGSIFSRKWLKELKTSENIVSYEQKQVLSSNPLSAKVAEMRLYPSRAPSQLDNPGCDPP
ncbi:cell adhesion molecule CEACAM6-like [Eucyclogobius newberryi]|uniref:cell adhesion molecule CEACAM6-like n=1 Tax=Eucyclogobius newberryi TaxID=166745 RepID=UPI003B5A2B49